MFFKFVKDGVKKNINCDIKTFDALSTKIDTLYPVGTAENSKKVFTSKTGKKTEINSNSDFQKVLNMVNIEQGKSYVKKIDIQLLKGRPGGRSKLDLT